MNLENFYLFHQAQRMTDYLRFLSNNSSKETFVCCCKNRKAWFKKKSIKAFLNSPQVKLRKEPYKVNFGASIFAEKIRTKKVWF